MANPNTTLTQLSPMTTDHYESAYASCTTTLTVTFDDSDRNMKESQYRAFWCPACERQHNFLKVTEDADITDLHGVEEPGSGGTTPGGSTAETTTQQGDEGNSDENRGTSESTDSSSGDDPDTAEPLEVESSPIDPGQYTVPELKDRLDSDEYDWNAAAYRGCYKSEVNGKARKTALQAIGDHIDAEGE